MPHRLIEKKRRDRINLSIGCLKDLLPDEMKTEVSTLTFFVRLFTKNLQNARPLEKAVVLELTIKYIRQLQKLLSTNDIKPTAAGKLPFVSISGFVPGLYVSSFEASVIFGFELRLSIFQVRFLVDGII